MLRGTQARRDDPVGNGALDDGSGQDAAELGSLDLFGWGGGGNGAVEDVVEVAGAGDPLPVFEDV